ncbi:MAG: hypothetical protein K8T26_02855 [Lentisphaerae bacterium]|nr:hypothetical protein [Lentisphaerota bacterium]
MLIACARLALGDGTNTWEFDLPNRYVYNPVLIGVTQSTARLLLQSDVLPFAEYAVNTDALQTVNLVFDEPASLQLSGTVGSYATNGLVTSRIMDAGLGNLWKHVTVAANTPVFVSDPTVASYLAMDNDLWVDQVSGLNGIPARGPTFSTDAKVGTHSGRFGSGSSLLAVRANPLKDGSQMSVAFWMKFIDFTHLGPILYSADGTGQFVYRQVISTRNYMIITIQTTLGINAIDNIILSPAAEWHHYAVTWDGNGADKRLQIYIDGRLSYFSTGSFGGTIKASAPVYLAGDGISRSSNIQIDDFIMSHKALTAAEVSQLVAGRSASFQSLAVQVRSGHTPAVLESRLFIGPDGTQDTSYFRGTSDLGFGADFSAGDRYVQYQARLLTDRNRAQSPSLRAVRFEGNAIEVRDRTAPEVALGVTTNLALLPSTANAPFIGLAKRPNGGFYTNGVYLSRVFDAGSSVQWARLDWQVTREVSTSTRGLTSLWHMDQNWNDAKGGFRATIVPNITFTPYAKIGVASAVFNGVDASASGFGALGSNAGIEFWIEDNEVNDEVMRLSATADVYITNRMIRVRGSVASDAVTVFVNGSERSPHLLSGWNHVVINIRGGVQMTDVLTVGEIPGVGFMSGKLDEMAVYTVELPSAEVNAHFVSGQREAAGRARLQISDSSLTNFFGPNGQADNYYTQPPVAGDDNVFAVLPAQRSFRYKLELDGDGNGTPVVRNVRITTAPPNAQLFTDDTAGNFNKGVRVAGETDVYGAMIGYDDIRLVGPLNLKFNTLGIIGLWHFDDESWTGAGLTVAAEQGNPGKANGDANTSFESILGTQAGTFDGSGDFVDSISSLASIGSGDFSASLWFNSSSTTPGAMFAVNDVFRYFILQLNHNGLAASPGVVAFLVNDGTGTKAAASPAGISYNDGHWHNVVGVRQGTQLMLYVDGARVSAVTVPGLGDCGQQSTYVAAKHPVDGTFYAGRLDEVSIFNKALTETEIGDYFGGAYRSGLKGVYESQVITREQPSTWQRMQWAPLGPYGRPMSVPPSDQQLIGLWHLDEAGGTVSNAVTANGLNGATPSGATYRQLGRFDGALDLNAAQSQYVQIPSSSLLEPSPERLTIEAWVNMDLVDNRTVISRRSGSGGYQLYTDASGRPVFWVGDALCSGTVPVRAGKWTHLAGVYNGARLQLYMDGQPVAASGSAGSLASGAVLSIGRDQNAANYFDGRVDEVAVHGRALTYGEIQDHYLAGAGFVGIQARSSMTQPFTAPYTGPGRTTNTYYTAFEGSDTAVDLDQGLYFQFRARFESEDYRYSPAVRGLAVYVAGYPADNPTIYPIASDAYVFPGHLLSFSDVRILNPETDVRYQLSGDAGLDPRWFYFDTSSKRWTQEDVGGLDVYKFQTSSASEVATNIPTFYSQVYNKTGGVFRARAFLHSATGQNPAVLDRVRVVASSGRINVVTPDGNENGDKSWLVSVPYDITWDYTPNVTGTIRIEFSADGGRTFADLNPPATAVPITNGIYRWTTPSTVTTQAIIRVTSNLQKDITDVSDRTFTLQQGLQIVQHNGGSPTWYIGETNQIIWRRSFLASPAHLEFSASGAFTGDQVRITSVPLGPSAINTLDWVTPFTNAGLVSEAGKLRVIQPSTPFYADTSDDPFQLAGAVLVRPAAGEGVKKGVDFNLQWVSAGMGPQVSIEIQGESNGPWEMIAPAADNMPGPNSYTWLPTNTPTENARIRFKSLSDPRANGYSHQFIVAAVELIQPLGNPNLELSEVWLQNTTQDILWISGGAGPRANILFSTNSGMDFMVIATNVVNINTLGVTNRYPWSVAQMPSAAVRVRVEDASKPTELFSVSPYDFQIAGLRVLSPNGAPEFWNKGDLENILWEQNSMGFEGTVEFSDNNGLSWIPVVQGPIIANRQVFYTPTNPTLQALVRISADSPPPPFTNVVDRSDKSFPVKGIRVVQPQQASLYTIGTTAVVSFVIASTDDQDGYAPIYYAGDGVTFDRLNPLNSLSDAFSDGSVHTFTWVVESFRNPSPSARLRVEAGNNPRSNLPYFALSDEFTIRGIKFTDPAPGSIWAPGLRSINWAVAGMSADAVADITVSLTGGTPGSYTNLVATGVGATVGTQPWLLPANLGPSTNARMRIRITDSSSAVDRGYFADSDPFMLQGLRVTQPARATIWNLGSPQTIRWDAAAGGDLVDLTLSADGGASYDARPIQTFAPSRDGTNAFNWAIDLGRTPSTNARVRVQSRQYPAITGESQPFLLRGIKILRPTGADIYATTDATNLITWLAVTTNSTFSLSFIVDGGPPQLIQTGITGSSYNWSIPPAAISTNVQIRITDGFHVNTSAVFRVVDVPTVAINTPVAGDFWEVGRIKTIEWSRGGQMPNDFSVYYSLAPYTVSNLVSSNANITFDAENNVFSMPWQVPNQLTQAVITVRHNDPLRTTVQDTSPTFNIVGRYRLKNPPGPFDVYALKPNTPIVWEALGSVPFVDLYYSLSAAHEPDSWVKINSSPIPMNQAKPYNAADLDNSWNGQSYPWTVVNARTAVAKVRVQEANYQQAFDPTEPGPFADSAEFSIYYYTIFWDVYDSVTTQRLDHFTIVDSSGWGLSDAATTNGIANDYTWGTFNTEIYREGFFDASILFWPSENTTIAFPGPRVWTQHVAMVRSQITEEYHVLANFSYDADSTNFTINAWMERGGTILEQPKSCTIKIYAANGSLADTITSTTPLDNGVFWMNWDASREARGAVFFAKVEIVYSGSSYSSGLTFTLTIPLSDTITEALEEFSSSLTSNLLGGVDAVLTNVSDVVESLKDLQDLTSAGFTNLTTLAKDTTNMLGDVQNDVKLLTNEVISVLGPKVDQLTNAVTTIGLPSLARILSRPEAVAWGSTNMLLYKTHAGYPENQMSLEVYPADSAVAVQTLGLSEVVPGLWQAQYTALWNGLGRYRLTVKDPNANDSIMLRVVSGDLYEMPSQFNDVSNQLATIETRLQGLDSLSGIITNDLLPIISNITVNVGDITNTLGVNFKFIEQQVGYLTNGLATLKDLDKIAADISRLTNSLGTVLTVTNLGDMVQGLTNALQGFSANDILSIKTNVQALSSTFAGGSWSQVLAIQSNVVAMTNALFAPEGMVYDLNLVTGKLANVNLLQMQQNLQTTTNSLGVLTNLSEVVKSLGSLSNSIDRLAGITNLSANVAAITNALSGLEIDWNDVKYIRGQVDVITNRLTPLDTIGTLGDSIRTLTNSVDRLVTLTNMSGQLTALETAIAGADFTSMSNNLQAVLGKVNAIDWADVSRLRSDMEFATNVLNGLDADALSALLGPLTNAVGSILNVTNAIGELDWNDIKSLQSDVSRVTNQLAGIEASLGAVSELSNVVTSVGSLTNLESQLAGLSNAVGSVGNLTNLEGQISALANQLTGADWTDIQALQADVSAITNQLVGADWNDIKAMQTDIQVVTNSLAVISTLAGLSAQIDSLIVSVNAVGELTNTLAGANWGDVTTIEQNLTTLSTSLQGLNGVDLSTFDPTATARLEASMQRVALSSQVEEVMRMLGSSGGGAGTVFGQLDQLSDELGQVGVDAKNAAQRAQSAKSRANEAASAIQALQSDFDKGDLDKVMARVREIQGKLQQAAAELEQVPKDVDPGTLYASVRQMVSTVNQLAQSKGFPQLLEGFAGKGAGEGQGLDANAAKDLNLEIQKVRAGMEFMKELVDEMRFEPVVHESLLGVE